MIAVGDEAPDFSGVAHSGETVRLSALRGRVVVLFFFPKAFTPGCTREAMQFGAVWDQFKGMGAEVIGISPDDPSVQCDFAQAMKLDFPLIADPDRAICDLYGVEWPLIRRVRRVTLVIDARGIVRSLFTHELLFKRHATDALDAAQKIEGGAAVAPLGSKLAPAR